MNHVAYVLISESSQIIAAFVPLHVARLFHEIALWHALRLARTLLANRVLETCPLTIHVLAEGFV
jgi:hypothetical protein